MPRPSHKGTFILAQWHQSRKVLVDQLQPLEILFCPARLPDNALQGFPPERAASAMEHNGHSAAVSVVINLVGTIAPIKREPVAVQSGNEVASGEVAKSTVVDLHGSDGDCDARFDGNLHLVGWFLRNVFSMLKHALYYHAHHVMDLFEGFVFRGAPSGRSLLLKKRAVGVPARQVPAEVFVGFYDHSEIVGLHSHYYESG